MTVKRQYRSPSRAEQAAATRRRLLTSARRRFVASGYAATKIQEIAADADVSVQTFYAVFGSKRGVLVALLDEMESDAGLPALRAALEASADDPRAQLRLVVDFNVRLFDGARDILEVVRRAGADADPAMLGRTGDERRRVAQRAIVDGWAQLGALRPGSSVEQAAGALWALSGPESFRLFVIELEWPPERHRSWLFETLERELFGGHAG